MTSFEAPLVILVPPNRNRLQWITSLTRGENYLRTVVLKILFSPYKMQMHSKILTTLA